MSLSEVHDIISHLKRSIFPNDSVSLCILKDCSDIVGPSILSIINSSLYNGIVPVCLKQAIIEPILKKGNLDGYDLSNYRPISKLPILSKILEKVVLRQPTTFLTKNNILDKFQSGFRCRHSTESALLRVVNDLLLISDAGNHAALILLDLSAAFDTIDHSILLNRLKHFVGVQGTVYTWFASYLEQRSFTVKLGNCFSYSAHSTSGVPQGSILGPVLFALYMLPLGRIFKKHGISYHLYADDTRIYLPLRPTCNVSCVTLRRCLDEVKDWLADNLVQLNERKTEMFMIFGRTVLNKAESVILGPWACYIQDRVKNLGVIFDSSLKFDNQINTVVRNCFFIWGQ